MYTCFTFLQPFSGFKECIFCNGVANLECKQCAGDLQTKSGRVHGYFCNTCSKQVKLVF